MASAVAITALSEQYTCAILNGSEKFDGDGSPSVQPIPIPVAEHAPSSPTAKSKSSPPNVQTTEAAEEKISQSFTSYATEPTLDERDSMADSHTSPSSESGSLASSEEDVFTGSRPFFPVKPTLSMHSRGRSTFRHGQLEQVSAAAEFSRASPRRPRRFEPLSSSTSASREARSSQQGWLDNLWSKELNELWIRLHDKRKGNQQLRRDMAAKRKKIKALRSRKDAADNSFMQLIRPRLAGVVPTHDASINGRFADMQAIRDEYNTAELEYEQLEKRLDLDDHDMRVLETEFFTLLFQTIRGSSRDSSPAPSENEEDVPPSRASLLGISGDRPSDVHPLYYKLLDAVGYRELARERLTELFLHRDAIIYELEMKLKIDRVRDEKGETRHTFISPEELQSLKSSLSQLTNNSAGGLNNYCMDIRDEDLEFLNDFERQEAEAKEELAETSQTVDRLREICMDKGFMRKNPPYHEEFSVFSAANAENPNVPPGNISIGHDSLPKTGGNLAHPHFPILLSNPSHVLQAEPVTARGALKAALKLRNDDPTRAPQVGEAMKEFGILTLFEQVAPEDKSDFINRWLLHRLRISPMEIEQLYSTFSSVLRPVNLRRWQEDVLYHWPRDAAANIASSTFEGPLTAPDELEIDASEESRRVNSAIEEAPKVHNEPGDDAHVSGKALTPQSP